MTDVANSRSTPCRTLEEGLLKIGDAGHEAALTAVGLGFLGAKRARRMWRNREAVLDMAQARGVDIESDAVACFRKAEERMNEQVDALRSVRNRAKNPRDLITQLASTVRDRVDSELAQYGVSFVDQAAQEIEIAAGGDGSPEPTAAASADRSNPLDNYDEMTAKEIVAQLSSLSADELTSILEYERQKRKRVTVLRAVEGCLAEL